jgi:hypothetical protein
MKDLIGKHVIVRSHMAGVFFAILKEKNGSELTLSKARKFYRWSGANTVEDLADKGSSNVSECKLTIEVDEMVIFGFEQIIPCTDKAIENIKSIKVWSY